MTTLNSKRRKIPAATGIFKRKNFKFILLVVGVTYMFVLQHSFIPPHTKVSENAIVTEVNYGTGQEEGDDSVTTRTDSSDQSKTLQKDKLEKEQASKPLEATSKSDSDNVDSKMEEPVSSNEKNNNNTKEKGEIERSNGDKNENDAENNQDSAKETRNESDEDSNEKERAQEANEEDPEPAKAEKEEQRQPWQPPDDEGLDPDHLPQNTTGAFKNCTKHTVKLAPPHPDQENITLSCHTLSYRMPSISSSEKILIGVLSTASGDGPGRRKSIRETWGQKHSVFFLVAGPWEDIAQEYDENKDLIWIDEEEVYDGEKSVLTYKTLAFVKIVYNLSTNNNLGIQYAFKTDDDSFINVVYLNEYLLKTEREEEYNYWGWCMRKMFKPLRGGNDKWAVSTKLYPEPRYPRYCQGAGFALSWKFISCAAGPSNYIDNARFMPFEDVAMGLVAQRCGIIPTMAEDERLIHMYRTDRTEERERVNQGLAKISKKKLPIPDMEGRIVQHRIHDAWDMREHYKQVLDPEEYKKKTTVEWYYHEDEEKEVEAKEE